MSEVLQQRPLPRALVILLAAAAAVIVVIGMRQLDWLLGPVFLALVIVSLVHPLHERLRRRNVPEVVALGVLLVAIYGLIALLVAILVYSVARLVAILPQYAAGAAELLQALSAQLTALGVSREQAAAILSGLDFSRLVGLATDALRGLVGFGANLVFLLSLLLFLGIESTSSSYRLGDLVRTRPRTADALLGFAIKTRRFLAVTTVFAVLVGIADTILLWALDIPLAPLWGLLAAVCNYIPYVGFVIGLVPPALLALLGGGWQLMLVVIVAYIVLNSILTTLIPPYFVGDAVSLSITLTLLSVVFWSWVLGPLGAVLAVPLTLLVKALLVDADPRATWLATLIGPGERRARMHQASPPLGRPSTAELKAQAGIGPALSERAPSDRAPEDRAPEDRAGAADAQDD